MARNNVVRKEDVPHIAGGGEMDIPKDNRDLVLGGELDDLLEQTAGQGVSSKAEDNLVPMVGVLQALSPAVDRKNAAHVQGAEPGAFILKNSPVPIIPGDDGFEFIPAFFEVAFVEWRPREMGGGFITRHKAIPQEAKKTRVDETTVKWFMPNGHEIKETRYHSGIAILPDYGPMPFMLPLSGANISTSKRWQTLMNSVRTPKGNLAASYARVYRVTTKQVTNAKGTWYGVDVKLERMVAPAEFHMARNLHDQMEAGKVKLAAEDDLAGSTTLDNQAI